MKKLTVMTIVLAILLALTTAVCAAEVNPETQKATLTLTPGKVSEENTVTVTVGVKPAVNQWDFTLKYDKNALTYKSISPDTNEFEHAEGKRFVGNSTSAKDTFTITFEVKEGVAEEATKVSVIDAKSFGSRNGDEKTSYEVDKGTEISVPLVVETTPSPTVTPTTEPTQEPTQEPTTEPTSEPTTEPTQEPTQGPTTTPDGKDDPSNAPTMPSSSEPNTNDEDEAPSTPADGKEEPTTFDKTGVSVAFVGIIAAVVIAGAVVLIKRK